MTDDRLLGNSDRLILGVSGGEGSLIVPIGTLSLLFTGYFLLQRWRVWDN